MHFHFTFSFIPKFLMWGIEKGKVMNTIPANPVKSGKPVKSMNPVKPEKAAKLINTSKTQKIRNIQIYQ